MADSQQIPAAPPPTTESESVFGRPDETMAFGVATAVEPDQAGVPQMAPPEETLAAGLEEGVSAWLTNRKILRLWTNSATKNSWISIQGLGWRRLHGGSESPVVCMTMLAAHARAHNRTVNLRIEADNTVHEIYVW